jgi:hypothetical protein
VGGLIRAHLDLGRWLFKLPRPFRSWTAINCRDRAPNPIIRKFFLLALALSAEAYRIFAFIVLAKAAPQYSKRHDLKGRGNLKGWRFRFDIRP